MTAPAARPAARPPAPVVIEPPITLGQFVKLAGFAATGGEAKRLVASGLVTLNGQVERRRGHRLSHGDVVEALGQRAEAIAPRQTPADSRCPSAG
jgi:ribosome-associated protein